MTIQWKVAGRGSHWASEGMFVLTHNINFLVLVFLW